MPKRKSPPNTFWRGSVLWGRIKVKGRDIKWSLRTSNPAVASSRVEAERERQIASAYYGDERKLCDDAMLAWAEYHIAHSVAPSTALRYAVSLKQLRPWLEGRYIDDVNRKLVIEIVDGRRAAGATNATIRRDLTALSSVLEFAADQGWRNEDENPALARLKRLTERRDPIILPEPDQIERVIRRSPGMFGAMIRAAWLTGCRLDELVRAERANLDHERRRLTVIGKGRKLRVVALDGAAFELLRSLPARIRCPYLFWHHDGKIYQNASSRFAAIVRSEAMEAERENRPFRRFRFHDLRHRYAVDYLKAGGNIYHLQKQLGHSHLGTTEIYLRFLTPEEALAARYGAEQSGPQQKADLSA